MEGNEIISLGERKREILFCAVDNYIKKASPITSLFIQQTNMQNYSTATLRNELSALEAMGYLRQLHTSGGRVPTPNGYRFYVNEILKNTTCTKEQLLSVKKDLYNRTGNLNEVIKTIADTITKTTNYPAVVVLDGFDNLIFKAINLFKLVNGQIMVLIDTNAGVITNTVLLKCDVEKTDLDNASKVFSEYFFNKDLGYLIKNVKSFSKKLEKSLKFYEEIFEVVLKVLQSYSSESSTSEGLTKLLSNPEYEDTQKAKGVFEVLSNKKKLRDVFDTSDSEGVVIKIGEENKIDELSSCAVIKTPITLDGNKIASIGIIGPQRIDYATVAGVLKIIADEINKR